MRLLILFFACFPLVAFGAFWQGHDKGWHWYEWHEEEKPKDAKKAGTPVKPVDATAQIQALKQLSEERLNTAMLSPTEPNVLAYLRIQKQLMAMAGNFSNTWQKVVWQHPDLDESVQHPVSDLGQQIYAVEHRQQQTQALKQVPSDYGLFFYFDSHCPYCKKMAPTVKAFSDMYGFELLPITIDGVGLPEFPNAKADNGSAQKLNVQAVPALYLIHHKTQSIIAVGFGLLTMDDMESRIVSLVNDTN